MKNDIMPKKLIRNMIDLKCVCALDFYAKAKKLHIAIPPDIGSRSDAVSTNKERSFNVPTLSRLMP